VGDTVYGLLALTLSKFHLFTNWYTIELS